MQVITVVDVLENALQGDVTAERARSLSDRDIDELLDHIEHHYESWAPPPMTTELRMYTGTGVAGGWLSSELRDYLFSTLLYYPSVVVHDPLARYADRHLATLELPSPPVTKMGFTIGYSEADLLATSHSAPRDYHNIRQLLEVFLPVCAQLAPLFRAGVVIPVAPWKIARHSQQQILTAVRHDVRDQRFVDAARNYVDDPPSVSDQIQITAPVLGSDSWKGGDTIAVAQAPSYFLNRTLAVADSVNARFVPSTLTDQSLVEAKLRRLHARNIDMVISRALESATLPLFRDLEPSTLLKIRRDNEAFEDWRSGLRSAIKTIESAIADEAAFKREANEVLGDLLIPKANELLRQSSASAVMRGHTATEVAEFSIGAAILYGAADITNTQFAIPALAALGATGAGKWLYKTIFRDSLGGSLGVLAALVKRPGIHRDRA
jgi:hypothetical protein